MFIQTLARILAGKFGLDVQYSSTASTFAIGKREDGRLVLFMARHLIEAGGESEEAVGDLTRGALAHEALGHGFHTDFESRAQNGPYAHGMANALEDIRIERLAPERFIGARRYLSAMASRLCNEQGFWAMPEDGDWQGCLLIGLLRKYRKDILGQPIAEDVTAEMLARAEAALGQSLFAHIEGLARSACFAEGTAEVCAAADEIVRLLREAQLEEPEERPRPNPEGRSDADADDQEAAAGDEPADDGSDGRDQAEDGQTTESSTEDGDEGPDEEARGRPESGDNADAGDASASSAAPHSDKDDSQGVDDGANGTSGTGPSDGGLNSPSPCGDKPGRSAAPLDFDPDQEVDTDIKKAVDQALDPRADENPYDIAYAGIYAGDDAAPDLSTIEPYTPDHHAKALIPRITGRLEDALRAHTEDGEDRRDRFGHLDISRLATIAAGVESEAFLTFGSQGEGINTEIMLVFDASASMNDLGCDFLRDFVYATVTSMAKFSPDLGVSLATFTSRSEMLIRPGQAVTPLLARKAAACYRCSGGTQWSSSVAPLVPVLASSRRPRKVMLTVTDGKLPTSNEALARDMHKQGIESRFVCIGRSLPSGYEGLCCEQTPTAFAKALCQTILAGALPSFQ